MTPAGPELDEVVRFVADQQAQVERRITYVGTEPDGIRAELDGLAPPWASTLRVRRGDGGDRGGAVTAAVVVEWDEELGRSWIIGPWVGSDDDGAWARVAGELLDEALAQVPAGVTRHEMAGDTAHRRLAALAAARGWHAGEISHLLVADAAVVAAWPDPDDEDHGLRGPTAADVAAIATLHDAEFPDTYASAAQLVAGGLDGTRVVLIAEAEADAGAAAEAAIAGDGPGGGPVIAGYAAGEVHDDGEGFVDFLAVDPAVRSTGVGRRLVVALTRRLLDRSPLGRVGLTVQHHRAPARALYGRLGFRSDGTLVGYRSWVAGDADPAP